MIEQAVRVRTPRSGVWYLLVLQPDKVQQLERLIVSDEASLLQGMHATTIVGAINIAKERRLRAFSLG